MSAVGENGAMEWAHSYAAALQLTLTDEEIEEVLRLARLVAHGTERRNAPLAAFLAGRFVGRPAASESPPAGALSEAVAAAERLLDAPGSC